MFQPQPLRNLQKGQPPELVECVHPPPPERPAGATSKMEHMTVVNHHADHPGFAGPTGLLMGLFFAAIGGPAARLAAEVAEVSSADRVIDIGCGPGSFVREAARRGAQVIGIDPAPVMLRLARMLTRDQVAVRWVEGSAEDLRQPAGSATVYTSIATVHHWADAEAGVAQAFQVLSPGGRLVAIERASPHGATGIASHGWTERQAEVFTEMCRAAGFAQVAVERRRLGRRDTHVVRAVRR